MNSVLEQYALRPLVLGENEPFTRGEPIRRHIEVTSVEAAAAALLRLWHELELGPPPLIFLGAKYGQHWQYHALLLDKVVKAGNGRKRPRFGQINGWERLESPSDAHGIAEVSIAGPLLKADLIREASVYDRKTVPGAMSGWYRYDFSRGWTALAVMLTPDEDGESVTITAVPDGRQDEWLALLESLRHLHTRMLHRKRQGRIEILGDGNVVVDTIKNTTFADVILPEETLLQVASQRRIFEPALLDRYRCLGVPRMRKILLVGPPGTGKSTLLKAEASHHIKGGGHVIYVFAAKKEDHSWERLEAALLSAALVKLPTLVLVEDFEHFVSGAEDFQRVLNTLDGIATPDNPAGTLVLATTNAPEKIDARIKDRPGRIDVLIEIGPVEQEDLVLRFFQRFLGAAYSADEHAPLAPEFKGQTGSYIREVCLMAAIHALDNDRATIVRDDLIFAHETLTKGRLAAADQDRCALPSPKRRGLFFGQK